ncbi:SDR family oxidoreductase [Streptosporangium minutum]|uniref:SDR family oxidoreductase n=1 Tax=Streptosporangium minutum TaxID=569862 RepID=UPI001F6148BB|nr:NAD(P)H-binding protein [Streptosporangium minutum]
MPEQRKVLVIGATGTVGRQVVAQLLEAGAEVRALARDPGTAGLPDGVEIAHGDLTDPDTLHAPWTGSRPCSSSGRSLRPRGCPRFWRWPPHMPDAWSTCLRLPSATTNNRSSG